MKIQLKNVRLAFAQLFEPKQVNGEGKPAYSCSLLLAPDHPQLTEIRKIIDQVGQEHWKDKWPTAKKAIETKDRICLKDGDNKADYEGFPGNFFISARNTTRPGVYDVDRTPLTERDGKPYGGCYVYANVDIWAQDNEWGKGINCTLLGIQFYRDGDAFVGGVSSTADDFEDLAAGADASGELV
jgi:hypothetical protein